MMLFLFIFLLAGTGLPDPIIPGDDRTTVFLIGDSTMADKSYEGGNPEKGWGQVFPLYFTQAVTIENHAANGRSTKSFRDEGRWDVVLERLKPGDYVIIQFGHNDQKIKDPARYAAAGTDYRSNLERFVSETRQKGGIPVLATPIVRRRFDENGRFYDTHGQYPEVVREVALDKGVVLIDLHRKTAKLLKDYGEEGSKRLFLHLGPDFFASLPDGKRDDTHLSGTGAFRVCDLVVEEVRRLLPDLAMHLKEY